MNYEGTKIRILQSYWAHVVPVSIYEYLNIFKRFKNKEILGMGRV
jgi:hypothetical protein